MISLLKFGATMQEVGAPGLIIYQKKSEAIYAYLGCSSLEFVKLGHL